MKTGQVTIKDLAGILGISPSTVSRALQGHPDISEETKNQVKEAAVRFRYRPNVVAQSLKQGRSGAIGVIIPELVHFFFSQIISGIEDVAYEAGYTVIICQSNEKYDREVNNAKMLLAHQVEGILVSISKETFDFQHLKEIGENRIPLVFFDREAPGVASDRVVTNDREAAYEATRHLTENGRKRIAHFSGPRHLTIGKERIAGYVQALADAGLPIIQELCPEVDSFEKATRQIEKMSLHDLVPDAIFATNDLTAIGAMKALKNRGFRIPEDVAIVGFSDGRFAEIADPLLTSVDQHGFEMGTLATQLLINRIRHTGPALPFETRIVKADLVIRKSSVS